jgi:hypothetical protein
MRSGLTGAGRTRCPDLTQPTEALLSLMCAHKVDPLYSLAMRLLYALCTLDVKQLQELWRADLTG